MKPYSLVLIGGGALLLAACIPSVYPFYSEKDLAFDNRLLGEWHEKAKTNDAQVWTFEKADDKGYKLKVTEAQGKSGELSAHLFKLKEDYFLDLLPTECNYASNQADLVSACMFPGHLLARVSQIEPELKIALFDFDWLEKFLEQEPGALAHYKGNGPLLLTASTAELQQFVLKHPEVFGKPSEMTRKPN